MPWRPTLAREQQPVVVDVVGCRAQGGEACEVLEEEVDEEQAIDEVQDADIRMESASKTSRRVSPSDLNHQAGCVFF